MCNSLREIQSSRLQWLKIKSIPLKTIKRAIKNLEKFRFDVLFGLPVKFLRHLGLWISFSWCCVIQPLLGQLETILRQRNPSALISWLKPWRRKPLKLGPGFQKDAISFPGFFEENIKLTLIGLKFNETKRPLIKSWDVTKPSRPKLSWRWLKS